jgi:hypothetical protein
MLPRFGPGFGLVSLTVSLAKDQLAVESEMDYGSTFTVFLPNEMGI